jgi:hypothetical protein
MLIARGDEPDKVAGLDGMQARRLHQAFFDPGNDGAYLSALRRRPPESVTANQASAGRHVQVRPSDGCQI